MDRLRPIFFFITIAAAAAGCTGNPAQKIVSRAIETHGGSAYDAFELAFDFRDRHYTASRNHGRFVYTRAFTDSTGQIKDALDNHGFTRFRNDQPVALSDERAGAFTRSVNAVIYFTLLPYGLNDDPVIKEFVKETMIDGEPYDVIRVTFEAHEGGHQDIYLYWFHRDKHTMDYFAYSYETDGGGIRFRKAVNPRKEGDILWQDYINYRPEDATVPIDSLESMYVSGRLRKLSEIKMENIRVVR